MVYLSYTNEVINMIEPTLLCGTKRTTNQNQSNNDDKIDYRCEEIYMGVPKVIEINDNDVKEVII